MHQDNCYRESKNKKYKHTKVSLCVVGSRKLTTSEVTVSHNFFCDLPDVISCQTSLTGLPITRRYLTVRTLVRRVYERTCNQNNCYNHEAASSVAVCVDQATLLIWSEFVLALLPWKHSTNINYNNDLVLD